MSILPIKDPRLRAMVGISPASLYGLGAMNLPGLYPDASPDMGTPGPMDLTTDPTEDVPMRPFSIGGVPQEYQIKQGDLALGQAEQDAMRTGPSSSEPKKPNWFKSNIGNIALGALAGMATPNQAAGGAGDIARAALAGYGAAQDTGNRQFDRNLALYGLRRQQQQDTLALNRDARDQQRIDEQIQHNRNAEMASQRTAAMTAATNMDKEIRESQKAGLGRIVKANEQLTSDQQQRVRLIGSGPVQVRWLDYSPEEQQDQQIKSGKAVRINLPKSMQESSGSPSIVVPVAEADGWQKLIAVSQEKDPERKAAMVNALRTSINTIADPKKKADENARLNAELDAWVAAGTPEKFANTLDRAGNRASMQEFQTSPEKIAAAVATAEAVANGRIQSGMNALKGDPSLDILAEKWLLDGTLPPNMGRASGLGLGIIRRAAELAKERGQEKTAIFAQQTLAKASTSAMGQMEKQYNQVVSFERTARKNLDNAVATAAKIVDTKSPLFNRPVREVAKRLSGDPKLAAFEAARQTAVNEIAKVLSSANASGGQAISDSARTEVNSMLSGDYSLAQIQAAANVLKQDMQNRIDSLEEQRRYIVNVITPGAQLPASMGGSEPAKATKRYNQQTGKLEVIK